MLARRTHISIETWDRGLSAAAEAAEPDGGADAAGSPGQEAREVEHYQAGVAAERASQEADTDQDADAIAAAAPDIVPVRTGVDAASH